MINLENRKNTLTIIFILGLINSLFFIYGQKLVVDSFQLVERGYLLTEGYLVPFGPRSTNTNMIYGSLISLVSGIPLFIYNHPVSIGIFILVLQFIGVILLSKVKFLKINPKFTLTFFLLYWVSPWRASEAFIWNASLLFFTASLYLYSLDYLRENKGQKDFLGTIIHGFAYMFTFQIHNSVIIFGPITLYYWYKKDIRLSIKGIITCCLFFIIMLFPTMYAIKMNPKILEYNTGGNAHLFANFVNFGEGIKGLTYWLRYPSLYFGSTTFQLPKVPWNEMSLLNQIWSAIKWGLGGISVFFILFANIKYVKKFEKGFIKQLTTISFCSLAIISFMSPVPFNFWHLYLIYPFTLIPLAWYIQQHKKANTILVALCLYFSSYSLIEAYDSYKHSFSANKTEDYRIKVLERKDAIIEKYKDFSLKIF